MSAPATLCAGRHSVTIVGAAARETRRGAHLIELGLEGEEGAQAHVALFYQCRAAPVLADRDLVVLEALAAIVRATGRDFATPTQLAGALWGVRFTATLAVQTWRDGSQHLALIAAEAGAADPTSEARDDGT